MISGHGNNIYQYGTQEIKADFSSNIAFNNHSGEILAHLAGAMSSLCNYPDPSAVELTRLVAAEHGVEAEQVLITNGSAEAFYLVAHYLSKEHKGCRTAIAVPSFAEYEDSCRLFDHDIRFINYSEIKECRGCESLWFASPNNPDGERVSMGDVNAIAESNKECTIVLDRAYSELMSERESLGSVPDNLIVIESFTKLFGIPGLRLGYIVASKTTIEKLTNMRPPWSVNSLSLVAGEYIVKNRETLLPNREELIGESLYLQNSIAVIETFRVTKSTCNFFLVEILDGGSAKELQEHLLSKYGFLIRDCSNFRSLGSSFFRIAAQNRELNNQLIEALQRW